LVASLPIGGVHHNIMVTNACDKLPRSCGEAAGHANADASPLVVNGKEVRGYSGIYGGLLIVTEWAQDLKSVTEEILDAASENREISQKSVYNLLRTTLSSGMSVTPLNLEYVEESRDDAEHYQTYTRLKMNLYVSAAVLVVLISYFIVFVPMQTRMESESKQYHLMLSTLPDDYLCQIPVLHTVLSRMGEVMFTESEIKSMFDDGHDATDEDSKKGKKGKKGKRGRRGGNLSSWESFTRLLNRHSKLTIFLIACISWSWWIPVVVESYGFRDIFDEYFGMTVAMVFGSFIAGATSLGGAVVAFPVLHLVYDVDTDQARDIGLMLQSVGMVSAALFIILTGLKIDKKLIKLSIVPGAIGTAVGFMYLHHLPPDIVKTVFSSLWLGFSFGMLTTSANSASKKSFDKNQGMMPATVSTQTIIEIFLVSFIGGIVTSFTGGGIDILLFLFTTAFYKLDERIGVLTSVVIMAINTSIGTGIRYLHSGDFSDETIRIWLAIVPVCCLAAPLGSYFISKQPFSVVKLLFVLTVWGQYIGAFAVLIIYSAQLVFVSVIITLVSAFVSYMMSVGGIISQEIAPDVVEKKVVEEKKGPTMLEKLKAKLALRHSSDDESSSESDVE
jgi:uncharacterized membrane protein YfcA